MVRHLINRDNLIPLISLFISLIIGFAVTYNSVTNNDATLTLRVEHLEEHKRQAQKERNILQVRLSNISTQIHETLAGLDALSRVVVENTNSNKKIAESNRDIAILIARLEERIKKTDERQEKLEKVLTDLVSIRK